MYTFLAIKTTVQKADGSILHKVSSGCFVWLWLHDHYNVEGTNHSVITVAVMAGNYCWLLFSHRTQSWHHNHTLLDSFNQTFRWLFGSSFSLYSLTFSDHRLLWRNAKCWHARNAKMLKLLSRCLCFAETLLTFSFWQLGWKVIYWN